MRQLLERQRGAAPLTGERYTFETVETVYEDGDVRVGGIKIPAIGLARVRAGQKVAIRWKAGRPAAAVAIGARRGKPIPPSFQVVGPIVEMLFLAVDPTTGLWDVFFRNASTVVALGLSGIWPDSPPLGVRWGTRTDMFLVQIDGTTFAIFAMQRDIDTPLASGPGTVTLLRIERPWDHEPLLWRATFAGDFSGTIKTDVWSLTATFDHANPPAIVDSTAGPTAGPTDTFETHADVSDVEIRITEALVTFGLLLVRDAQLDDRGHLILSYFVAGNLDAGVLGIEPIETGNTTQVAASSVSAPCATLTFEHGDPDGIDFAYHDSGHLAIVDNTAGALLWGSFHDSTIVQQGTDERLEGHQRYTRESHLNDIGHAPPDYVEEQCLTEPINVAHGQEISQSAYDILIAGAVEHLLAMGLVRTRLLRDSAIDAARLSFLGDEEDWYQSQALASTTYVAETAAADAASPHVFAVQLTTTGNDMVRVITHEFEGTYIPRRGQPDGTGVVSALRKGLVFLHVKVQNNILGARQEGVWIIDAETDAIAEVVPVTTLDEIDTGFTIFGEPLFLPLLDVRVISANAFHLLWRHSSTPAGAGTIVDRILLTRLDTGESKVVAEGPAVFTNRFGAYSTADAVAAFLARGAWHVLRPDFLYLRNENAGEASQQFIQGWDDDDTPTLDVTAQDFPAVITELRDQAVLEDLPATVSPSEASVGPSLQALNYEPFLIPTGRFEEDAV